MLEASLDRNGTIHRVSLLPAENAVLAFFYEDTLKIGTLAVSTPGLREEGVGTSSVLLGGKYLIAARALSERVAATYHKMSIVSINTKLSEGEALRVYANLLDKARSNSASTDPASPED
ncbi:MAG TPA: hypothetical protein VFE96_09210 [Candidatus Bathyarchaeia archaeon]|jgi:hypothetical protein|nr:hypothetical protein [Candidatus Bathyarchaeia archaeon]